MTSRTPTSAVNGLDTAATWKTGRGVAPLKPRPKPSARGTGPRMSDKSIAADSGPYVRKIERVKQPPLKKARIISSMATNGMIVTGVVAKGVRRERPESEAKGVMALSYRRKQSMPSTCR